MTFGNSSKLLQLIFLHRSVRSGIFIHFFLSEPRVAYETPVLLSFCRKLTFKKRRLVGTKSDNVKYSTSSSLHPEKETINPR